MFKQGQKQISLLVFLLFLFGLNPIQAQNPQASEPKVYTPPAFFTFEELLFLSENPNPEGALGEKLYKFFRHPIISNEVHIQGHRHKNGSSPLVGDYIRATSWNIEKSLSIDRMIPFMTQEAAFNGMLDREILESEKSYEEVRKQWKRLIKSDILILQEMEIGMKRSGYRNAAHDLAQALQMNYAFAPQYLEIDPALLGTENIMYEEGQEDTEAEDYYRVDPKRYKGVFGSAVLSKYPIKYVEIKPLENQPYDWYHGEKKKISFLEKTRRFGTKTLFKNELTREMKIGGRPYFRVDLHVPGMPNDTLTIINVHLEIKSKPKGREKQLEEILGYIKEIRNPLVLMGDFNAAPADISPTTVTRTVKRAAKNPTTWLNAAVTVALPQSTAINASRGLSNVTKNFNDPFATDVAVVAPNPLKDMFQMIREFRFSDGTVFDFRGDPNRSVNGKAKLLSNSNERGFKGFKTTFKVKRPISVLGKLRLDWVFVKSGLMYSTEDANAPYQYAPHFGETLEELNTSLQKQLSDHHPNLVDIPLEEPLF